MFKIAEIVKLRTVSLLCFAMDKQDPCVEIPLFRPLITVILVLDLIEESMSSEADLNSKGLLNLINFALS